MFKTPRVSACTNSRIALQIHRIRWRSDLGRQLERPLEGRTEPFGGTPCTIASSASASTTANSSPPSPRHEITLADRRSNALRHALQELVADRVAEDCR